MTYSKQNRISWNDKWMLNALIEAERSPDPNTQVGCQICSFDNRPISSGYNAFPRGIDQDDLPWIREGQTLKTKYPYVVHAELNAILNSEKALDGSKMYVTLLCCNECAKAVIQSGVKEVYYLDDKYKDTDSCQAAIKMFEMTGITLYHYYWETERAKEIASFLQGD